MSNWWHIYRKTQRAQRQNGKNKEKKRGKDHDKNDKGLKLHGGVRAEKRFFCVLTMQLASQREAGWGRVARLWSEDAMELYNRRAKDLPCRVCCRSRHVDFHVFFPPFF